MATTAGDFLFLRMLLIGVLVLVAATGGGFRLEILTLVEPFTVLSFRTGAKAEDLFGINLRDLFSLCLLRMSFRT